MQILVSAGEASGDRYAAELVGELRNRLPKAEFFGCAGPRLRRAGVEPVIRSEDLAVVGVFEVAAHIPRIYGLLRKLAAAARRREPVLAILTDSPDFHLRLAARLQAAGIPVFYYVAPQVWAWRKGRVRTIRRYIEHLLCIFPFEEKFFRENDVNATYVGHPLAGTLTPALARDVFFKQCGFDPSRPLVALLPGSRQGEAARHLPHLREAVRRLSPMEGLQFVLPASSTTGVAFFAERIGDSAVQIIDDGAHNALGYADVALVASGTATVEAALLGSPMVTFYRVTPASWLVGKWLVDVPFYSMVNLLAGRRIVPELMQQECTGENLAREAQHLLSDEEARQRMKSELSLVRETLETPVPAATRAAEIVCERLS